MSYYSNTEVVSACCHAPIETGCLPNDPKDDKPVTCYYKCSKCSMPCCISSIAILDELLSIVDKLSKKTKSKRRNNEKKV